MIEALILSVLLLLFIVFLYWAYIPDYRREPKEFWRTLIGMPIGMLLGGLGYPRINEKIRKWASKETPKPKSKKNDG